MTRLLYASFLLLIASATTTTTTFLVAAEDTDASAGYEYEPEYTYTYMGVKANIKANWGQKNEIKICNDTEMAELTDVMSLVLNENVWHHNFEKNNQSNYFEYASQNISNVTFYDMKFDRYLDVDLIETDFENYTTPENYTRWMNHLNSLEYRELLENKTVNYLNGCPDVNRSFWFNMYKNETSSGGANSDYCNPAAQYCYMACGYTRINATTDSTIPLNAMKEYGKVFLRYFKKALKDLDWYFYEVERLTNPDHPNPKRRNQIRKVKNPGCLGNINKLRVDLDAFYIPY